MPAVTRLTCPACAENIQTNRVLPPGAKGKCPYCGTVFQVPAPGAPATAPKTMMARARVPDEYPEEMEDEVEDRPKKKKNKKGGILGWPLAVVGLVVLAVSCYLIWLFVTTLMGPTGPVKDLTDQDRKGKSVGVDGSAIPNQGQGGGNQGR
jgi:hypothetical protein